MLQEPILNYQQKNAVLHLTLNSPQTRNALSEAMLTALHEALDKIAHDKSIKVVVLKSTGAVFCSGHNLKEIQAHWADNDKGEGYLKWLLAHCSAMMLKLTRLPQPVIAVIEGTATAAGAQLVASCDLAYATPNAQFCTPGVNLGSFCSTPMVAISRSLSRKHAMEMLLSGDMVSAENALKQGFINEIFTDNISERVNAIAEKLSSRSAYSIAIGKKAFYEQLEMPLEQAYAHASQVMVKNMMEPNALEGIDAFFEKRCANFI